MPEGISPDLWSMLLVTHGPFIGAGLIYFIYWIWPGGGKDKQIAADKEKLAMQQASDERKEMIRADGIKALASSMDKHTDMDERRFTELIHLAGRPINMLRELPGAIGDRMRLKDDMLHGSKGDGGNV